MATATNIEGSCLRTSTHHAELLSLVAARATGEGKSDSPFPGLTFFRWSTTRSCTKTIVSGAALAVILQGQKMVRIGDESWTADPMQHLVITRETALESTAREAGPKQPYLSLSLSFSAETIVKALVALADAGAEGGGEVPRAFVQPVDDKIAGALVRLLRAIDDRIERKLVAPLIMEELALRLLQCDGATALRAAIRTDGDLLKVENAMKYMRAHAARPLSVQQIARHVGMSESHFAHRFRDVARVSPMRYLRHVRLAEARSLMLAEGSRPSEVAGRVGFESASHFTREFKRFYGASPGEYVRRFRE